MSQSQNEASGVSGNTDNEQLQFFRLHCCYYKAGKIRNCISVEQLQCFNEKTINLQRCKLQQEDVECIAVFVTSSSYKEWFEINLSNCGIIRDHIYKMYCKLSKCNDVTIKVLQLNNNRIVGVYSSYLSKIVINYKVQSLWINGNHAIGENKQFYIMLTNPSTRLEVLHMSDVKLSSSGAIYLFKALLNNNTLRELVVTNNNINDNACEAITAMLNKNNCLTKLWMWRNPISGEASKLILRALIENNSLERLGLPNYNDPTERIIRSLQETVNKQRQSHRCQVTLLVDFM